MGPVRAPSWPIVKVCKPPLEFSFTALQEVESDGQMCRDACDVLQNALVRGVQGNPGRVGSRRRLVQDTERVGV